MTIRLVLGSSSPRRKELLSRIGLAFEVVTPEVEEMRRPGELPEAYVRRNAEEKAAWVSSREESRSSGIIIAADTIVVLGKDVLEKPRDASDARRMLTSLGGATHTVISGVCLAGFGPVFDPRTKTFAVRTDVTLKALTDHEIDSYIASGEPMDKAGAYAAQGIGSYMVKTLSGSYTNVVGLPVAEVVETLENSFGLHLWGRA